MKPAVEALADKRAVFFPAPPNAPRVQFLASLNGAEDLRQGKKSGFRAFVLGDEDKDRETLVRPYGIAARNGVIYVCDAGSNCLVRMDMRTRECTTLGRDGLGKLRKPVNVAVDEAGYLFVADTLRQQVVVFSPEGAYVQAFVLPDEGRPVDVAVRGNELYVLDNDKTPQVVVMDRASGSVLRTFGSFGGGDGQFNLPTAIAVGPDGSAYVSDTLNFRIQKFSGQGEFLWTKGQAGRRAGEFARPKGIGVGPDGTAYVADAATEIVQMYNSEGQILMHLGGPGGGGDGSLALPASVVVDSTSVDDFREYVYPGFEVQYLVLVTSQFGAHRINVYAFGEFPEGRMPPAGAIRALLPPAATGDAFGPDAAPRKSPPKSTTPEAVQPKPKSGDEE